MFQCPIDFYINNLIFNADKSCWALFKLRGSDYDFLSKQQKVSMIHRTAHYLAGIMSEAQYMVIPVVQNLKDKYKDFKNELNKNDVLYETAVTMSDLTYQYLETSMQENSTSTDYYSYICVKLAISSNDFEIAKEKIAYFLKDPVNAINVFMNLDTKDILNTTIETCQEKAATWLEQQNLRIRMEAIETSETQWLLRRMSFRGLKKEVELFYESVDQEKDYGPIYEVGYLKNENKYIRPYKKDTVNLFEGNIIPKNRYLEVETDGETSYQSFLVLTHIADDFESEGCEWLYLPQKRNLQAELCVHIKAVEHNSALGKVGGKTQEIDAQIEHVRESGSKLPRELADGRYEADELEAELKANRGPLLYVTAQICIASNSYKTMEQRVNKIKVLYKDMRFGIERPFSDQVKLFMNFIPSVKPTLKDYIMPLTAVALASGIMGVTHNLGDRVGPYIGTTGSERKSVFLDMGLACRINKSPAATFFGDLGYGKSFNANLLVVLNVIYGGYGLIFDPKGERGHWEKDLTILNGLIKTVTLAPDKENKGKLDPYNIYRNDIAEANMLAINIITEMFGISEQDNMATALDEAANKIEEGEEIPSMTKLINKLDEFDKDDSLCKIASELARRIRSRSQNGMAQLFIGDGTEEAIQLDNRLNIIQIQNLKMPDPNKNKKEYDRDEMASVVIMSLLGQFAKTFAHMHPSVFKEVLFDESWALGKTKAGEALFNYLSRQGRSLYLGCLFNGHTVLDIPTQGIRNTITYKFCFHSDDDDEAKRMLEYLGLEVSSSNIGRIKNLKNRECLFKDAFGNVGILKFDAVFDDLITVFDTTPNKDKAVIEEVKKQENIKEKETQEIELDDELLFSKEVI